MANIRVSPAELRHCAGIVRGLIGEYNGTMSNYMSQTHANTGAGAWNGMAALANLSSSEDIVTTQNHLTTRWGGLCDQLEHAASAYEQQEETNASRQGAVGAH